MIQPRNFDLNIEKILEGWEVCHAVRELIANALDEQALTQTKDIEIQQQGQRCWRIRDYGRGLRYEHLTQNENTEKLSNPNKVIGKFGVGLKDALATPNRHGVAVAIRSKYGRITLSQSPKHGFNDVITLHAVIESADDAEFAGTEVVLNGVGKGDIDKAKTFFLKFSGEAVLDSTRLGQILGRCSGAPGRIYVTGLLVAEEENFAFSYNITSLTKRMRDALNRERTNVGRTAYTDRVKDILLESRSISVVSTLADELSKIQRGTNSDEVNWTDVAVHASKILNAKEDVLFVSSTQMLNHGDALDRARSDGIRIVPVPESIIQKISGLTDVGGNAIRDIQAYQMQYHESFKFKYVEYKDLSSMERAIFDKRHEIIALDGKLPSKVKAIVISETMRPDFSGLDHTQGLWDPTIGNIIIRRDQLRSTELFAGTLLHEVAHARGGHSDVTRAFEEDLTLALGRVASRSLAQSNV